MTDEDIKQDGGEVDSHPFEPIGRPPEPSP
jgi:hypothetical protein